MPFVVPILVFLLGLALVLSGLLRRPRGVIRIAVGASLMVGIGAIGASSTTSGSRHGARAGRSSASRPLNRSGKPC